MINVNGGSKYSATGFINDTGILSYPVEQWLRSVLIYLFTSVGVTSQSLKLFDLSFNELMYDRRVTLSLFLFPTNCSAVLLKNSLNFSRSTFSVFGLGLSIRCMTFHISFLFFD